LVSLVQQTLDNELGPSGRNLVGPSLSPITFAPPIPTGSRDVARRSVTNARLEDSEAALARSGYLQVAADTNAELWRVSLRAAAFENLDYGRFVTSVRAVVDPVLSAQRIREHVLKTLAENRPDGFAGASVCLWQQAPPAESVKDIPIESPEYQEHIYSTAVQQLLDWARLRLTSANVALLSMPPKQQKAAIDHFKTFDCVVAMGDIPKDEVELLKNAGVKLVEADNDITPLATTPTHQQDAAITAIYTGVVPIVYKAQRALLDNLIESSFWSFVTITPLMMLVCRGVFPGAVVMMPNVLPVLVVFGGMGWLNIAVDIGSMMAASIALGVAVDDTIHFLTWYREGLAKLGERKPAIVYAYRRAGPPTLQAGLISGLGLSVFAFSTFTPTQKLGWLMMTILIAGIVAELIMLPAILAGPLGRVFKVPEPATPPAVPLPHAPKRKPHLVSSQR
jgi:uncharacterized protein